ncbi:MAG: DEAD/DEAH box helicase [Phycisphaerae bacterium]|nr:DEAD/DEAH box helicase [Phycisphaerae bacterium]
MNAEAEQSGPMKFADLNLKPELLAGLKEIGYTELTPIQQQTFAYILSGRDMIAMAETGSGKTAACGVPLVQNVDPALREIQVLVLVPTRELALQYVREIASIARKTEIAAFAVYGGYSMDIQKSKLAHGVHILVATPGRLIDMLYNTPLRLSEVRTFVLDEADEMLNMGFIDDVEFVISCLVHEHQTLLFSATMPPEIKRLAARHLKDPVTIELNLSQVAPQSLEHQFQLVKGHQRFEALVDYLREDEVKQAIIFCNSRRNVEKLNDQLRKEFKSVESIHGGLEQSRRTSLFNRFRKMDIRLMVATDVASRGLDFSHVTHVINYDFPTHAEAYTHRTGRTARMGRKGFAMTFLTSGNLRELKHILKVNHVEPVWRGQPPDFDRSSGRSAPQQGRSARKGPPRRRRRGPSRAT